MDNLKTLILAAGSGTRMKSKLAKVLHKAAGKTLLGHIVDAAQMAGSDEIAVVIGHQEDTVRKNLPEEILTFEQAQRLGTGHAVQQAKEFFDGSDSTVIILNGDAPLITPETIEEMIETHRKNGNAVTVLTAEIEDPTGYGRIITEDGQIKRIVEEKDANDQERAIKEVNSGIYCFDSSVLSEALDQLDNNNEQGEFYLTDTIEIIRDRGEKAGIYHVDDSDEIASANSKRQLAQLEKIFRKRINNRLMDEGVIMKDPDTTYIDSTVKIGIDTIIYPGTYIEGDTIIGSDCIIGPNSHIVNTEIKDEVRVDNSTIYDSIIDSKTNIGPYAYLRPNSQIGKHVKIGDFVEVKNSVIKDGAKASHLTYIGDAVVGKNVNLGCGTVFVNYDGKNKNKTIVEDDCFIGCNTNLIAPVTVKKGSYTAAGSTITDDVPEDTLAIARAKQQNKIGYVKNMPISEEE